MYTYIRGCGRTRDRAEPCEPFPSAWTACGSAQAFVAVSSASAFNANISVWNTASVTSLSQVCAFFGPAARHRKRFERARPGFDAARPVVRGLGFRV